VRDHIRHRRCQVLRLGLGQEPDVTQVDPEQRDSRWPGQLGRSQERAVSPDDQDHLRAGSGRRRDRDDRGRITAKLGCLGLQHPDADARSRQPGDQDPGHALRCWPASMRNQ